MVAEGLDGQGRGGARRASSSSTTASATSRRSHPTSGRLCRDSLSGARWEPGLGSLGSECLMGFFALKVAPLKDRALRLAWEVLGIAEDSGRPYKYRTLVRRLRR